MEAVPASEVKRRGLGVLDERLKHGPVHVIKNDRLRYVILSEDHYQELLESQAAAERERIREALADIEAGRVRRARAQDLIDDLDLDA